MWSACVNIHLKGNRNSRELLSFYYYQFHPVSLRRSAQLFVACCPDVGGRRMDEWRMRSGSVCVCGWQGWQLEVCEKRMGWDERWRGGEQSRSPAESLIVVPHAVVDYTDLMNVRHRDLAASPSCWTNIHLAVREQLTRWRFRKRKKA